MKALDLVKSKILVEILNKIISEDAFVRYPHSKHEWQAEIAKQYTYKTNNGAYNTVVNYEVSDELFKGLVANEVFVKQGQGVATAYYLAVEDGKTIATPNLVREASVWLQKEHARKAAESYARRQAKEGRVVEPRKHKKAEVFTPKTIVIMDGYRFSLGFEGKLPKVEISKV